MAATTNSPDDRVQSFVDEFNDLTRTAVTEEELRAAFQSASVSQLRIRDLKLERNRQDARRNFIIVEFKSKGSFKAAVTSAKFREARNQLTQDYIPKQAKLDRHDPSDYVGVCFDGLDFAFVFIETNGRVRTTSLRKFTYTSAKALVLALDRDNRISLTPENISGDFGPYSTIAQETIGALWQDLNAGFVARTNRVEMLYDEWNDLFEQTTSLGKIGRLRLDRYLPGIGIPLGSNPTGVLFVLHTYHALVFKLLAAELVLANTLLPGTQSDYCFAASTLTDDELFKSLQNDIEDSLLFRNVNISNFVEGSFFSWYLVKPSAELANAIRLIMNRLGLYKLSGLSLSSTRDVIKRIYQELLPPVLRHNIGEFFTPEWLVEFTLTRVGYRGKKILDNRILDPCCGSGTFLIHAIELYKKQAQKQGWNRQQILKGVIAHIAGFDLNPLAVLTARINYLIAISDLIATHSEVEIPIYQADAVYAPVLERIGKSRIRKYEIGTRKEIITVELPESLIIRERLFGRIIEAMETAIKAGARISSFLADISREGEYVRNATKFEWEPPLRDMFCQIERLEKSYDWNRIWCRIVRNYFASIAIGRCQFIAGNPPWVRWSELPERYIERIKPTCESYEMFSEDKYFGGNELDISAMITYSVADKWLDDKGGQLSFVIPQQHYQSQSSGGFRRFTVKGADLEVLRVDDFVRVRPWRKLGNKPSVITLKKGSPTKYPVPYYEWSKKADAIISEDEPLAEARLKLLAIEKEANALSDAGHRWAILPKSEYQRLSKLAGEDPNLQGRKGILTDLNGAYFIELIGRGKRRRSIRCRNLPSEGDHDVPAITHDIEADLIYPLIKGARNIREFYATTSPLYVLVPNQRITPSKIPSKSDLIESGHLDAIHYFSLVNAHGLLDERSTWKGRMRPQYDKLIKRGLIEEEDVPNFAIYNVGEYTFAPYKVVWAEMAGSLRAAVIEEAELPFVGGYKPIVPDHKVYFVGFEKRANAHYVCALLNSDPIRRFIDSFTIKIQVGTLFRHLTLPRYDPRNRGHSILSKASQSAHIKLSASSGEESIHKEKQIINRIVKRILGLS
ncbi:MAG TPA: N-6 DNA methylase [Pyrinomonadaceae bacterium]|nr:N-6 DNA methylase [Pyrinomonadaceae bacterium]